MFTIIGHYYLEKWTGENEQPIIIRKRASTMKEWSVIDINVMMSIWQKKKKKGITSILIIKESKISSS